MWHHIKHFYKCVVNWDFHTFSCWYFLSNREADTYWWNPRHSVSYDSEIDGFTLNYYFIEKSSNRGSMFFSWLSSLWVTLHIVSDTGGASTSATSKRCFRMSKNFASNTKYSGPSGFVCLTPAGKRGKFGSRMREPHLPAYGFPLYGPGQLSW